MAPAGISRRHLLGLLAAGFATACTSTRRERGTALPSTTATPNTATTTTALPYVKELPGVRFLFLDANRPDDAQAAWLQNQLAAPGPIFSVAVFHQPVFSCGLHGRTATVIEHWYPILNSGRLSLVLNGHDH